MQLSITISSLEVYYSLGIFSQRMMYSHGKVFFLHISRSYRSGLTKNFRKNYVGEKQKADEFFWGGGGVHVSRDVKILTAQYKYDMVTKC
jgi:hypothetical protein